MIQRALGVTTYRDDIPTFQKKRGFGNRKRNVESSLKDGTKNNLLSRSITNHHLDICRLRSSWTLSRNAKERKTRERYLRTHRNVWVASPNELYDWYSDDREAQLYDYRLYGSSSFGRCRTIMWDVVSTSGRNRLRTISTGKRKYTRATREKVFSSKIMIILSLLFILLCKAFLKFYFLVKHDGFVFTRSNRSI